jgi:hypothetical protein
MLTDFVPRYELDINCKIVKDLSYYIGQELDHNLTVQENGDKYEFDVGDDVQMIIGNKPSVCGIGWKDILVNEHYILRNRETYDVLKYPYKTKIVSYSILGKPDFSKKINNSTMVVYIKNEETGQLYKLVESRKNLACARGGDDDLDTEDYIIVYEVNLDLTIKSTEKIKITYDSVLGSELNMTWTTNTRTRDHYKTLKGKVKRRAVPIGLTVLDLPVDGIPDKP